MKIEVCGKLVDEEIVLINPKGCEELDIDMSSDINTLSMNKKLRLVGLGKNGLYKMTTKSWKALKKHLNRTGQAWRYAT